MNNACSESLLHYNERENKNCHHLQNTSTGDKIGDYGTELQYFIYFIETLCAPICFLLLPLQLIYKGTKISQMKKIIFLLAIVLGAMSIVSCRDQDTYADKLERERKAINAFIVKHKINVISEKQFESQGFKTDTTKNQYVQFKSTGVYMQLVEEGIGEKLKNGETATILCRFDETNVAGDSLQLTNKSLIWNGIVDKMLVTKNSGTFTASFDRASSVMVRAYGSTSVPKGWLVPLPYIKLGRITSATDKLAHVRLIVPSAQGQTLASKNTYACFYDITYQRGV